MKKVIEIEYAFGDSVCCSTAEHGFDNGPAYGFIAGLARNQTPETVRYAVNVCTAVEGHCILYTFRKESIIPHRTVLIEKHPNDRMGI